MNLLIYLIIVENFIVRSSDLDELNRKIQAAKWKPTDSFNSTTFKILLGWKVYLHY